MIDTSKVPSRLAGIDRFKTAIAVAEQGWKAGADNVVLVKAHSFPDALAAGPLAYKLNAPILFTDRAELPASTLAEIQRLSPQRIILIGGIGVISQEVQDSLSAVYGKDNVIRYSGDNRYETAASLATALGTTGKAVIANGENSHYADVKGPDNNSSGR
jgi:putative cell wall-binding protein